MPAAALSAWLLVAFPLLLAGVFTPAAALIAGLPAVVLAVAVVPRWIPDLPDDTPWWPVAAVAATTVASAAVQVAYHSETLVIRRDAGSYAQFTAWIAQRGFLPIPQGRELLAGDHPALRYESLAYYEVGTDIWPQFLSGAPLTYSVGYWLGGLEAMFIVPPLIGALGVLTFAGLTARLVGARWAPLAALLLAVCLPQQWVSRSTYSEPVAQVLILGGLVLAFDALARPSPRGRWLAAAAGLAFGLGLVVRIDALRDILPVVAFAGLLLVVRRSQALPLLAGLAVGSGYGFVASFHLSRPYIEYLEASVRPLLAVSSSVVALTVLGVLVLWRRGLPSLPPWLAAAVPGLAIACIAGLALRPYIYVQRGHGNEATGDYIGSVQGFEGLPVDPARTYEEMSLYWVVWYAGPVAVALAGLGVALLLRRALRGEAPQWVLPLMLLTWTVALTLLRPAITPDHPWASRRLVVLVLPAFILLAVWAAAWLTRRLPGRRLLGASVLAAGVAALVVPAADTAAGLMTYRSDVGSAAETRRLCAAIPPDASVVIVDSGTASNFAQLIRGLCQVPTAYLDNGAPGALADVAAEIRSRDRVPVLISSEPDRLRPYLPDGTEPESVFDVDADQDPSTLMRPPQGPWPFTATLYIVAAPEV